MEMSLDCFKFHGMHICCYWCLKWGENYLAAFLFLWRQMFETNNLTPPFISAPSEPKLGGYFDFCSVAHSRKMWQDNVCIMYWDECLIRSISDSLGIRSWSFWNTEVIKVCSKLGKVSVCLWWIFNKYVIGEENIFKGNVKLKMLIVFTPFSVMYLISKG